MSAFVLDDGITGFRLETLEHASLPTGGPGLSPANGNFIFTEFTVAVAPVPEPGTVLGLAADGLGAGGLARRARRGGRNEPSHLTGTERWCG